MDKSARPAAPGDRTLVGNIGHCTGTGKTQDAVFRQGVEMVIAVATPGADGAVRTNCLVNGSADTCPLIHGSGKVKICRGVAAEAVNVNIFQGGGQEDIDHFPTIAECVFTDMGNTLGHSDFRQ